MDEPLAVALKFGFLAVLYLFLLWVARSALRDLRAQRGAAVPADAGRRPPRRERERDDGRTCCAGVEPRLEVVAAMGYEPGTVFDSATAPPWAARTAPTSASTTRSPPPRTRGSSPRGDFMYIEDMGSTNGTYLNGRQLRGGERLKVADVIRIGDTEYRYQE